MNTIYSKALHSPRFPPLSPTQRQLLCIHYVPVQLKKTVRPKDQGSCSHRREWGFKKGDSRSFRDREDEVLSERGDLRIILRHLFAASAVVFWALAFEIISIIFSFIFILKLKRSLQRSIEGREAEKVKGIHLQDSPQLHPDSGMLMDLG